MANEIQQIAISSTAEHGYYKITFDGQETSEISYADGAAAVQAALEALPTIGAGNVSVTQNSLTLSIEFIGSLANTSVPEVTITANTLGRNTIEVVSLGAEPASGNVLAKETGHGGGSATLPYTGFNDAVLESAGYPASLSVSGDWYPNGYTLTTPADVSLLIVAYDTVDSESAPLVPSYTKTQSYSSVSVTPSTVQEGSAAAASSSSVNISLLGVG